MAESLQSLKPGKSQDLGHENELLMYMSFIVRAYMRELEDFTLGAQIEEADKFDDAVVFYGKLHTVFQFKHKENEKVLTDSDLFTEKLKEHFNLLLYVKSYIEGKFKDTFRYAVLFTTCAIDVNKDNELALKSIKEKPLSWYKGTESIVLKSIVLTPFIPHNEDIFQFSHFYPNAKYYTFDGDKNIVKILKNQADSLKYDVTEDQIKDALKYIIYAVEQPNVKELKKIIQKELRHIYNCNNIDHIYDKLEEEIKKWCRKESCAFLPIITFDCVKKFFEEL